MSIYPVRLIEWYPLGDEHHEIAKLLSDGVRCLACYKKVRWKRAIAHHALPWGYGDVWCSWECCNSGKIAKPDKHQRRRKYKKFYRYLK